MSSASSNSSSSRLAQARRFAAGRGAPVPSAAGPYARFRLTSDLCDDFFVWSVALGRPCDVEQWMDIMGQLRPLILKVEQLEAALLTTQRWASFVILIVLGLWLPTWEILPATGHICFLLILVLSIVYTLRARMIYFRALPGLVATINATCQEYPMGTLECKLLADGFFDSKLYLYSLHTDTVYEELVVNNGFWTRPVQALPPLGAAFDAWLPRDEWEALQSAIKMPILQNRRMYIPPTVAIFVAWELTKFYCRYNDSCVMSVAMVLATMFGIGRIAYLFYHYFSCFTIQMALVQQYSAKWASRGMYLEHRKVVNVHPWRGLVEQHVLFVAHASKSDDDR